MDRPMLFGKYCLLERISVGGMAEIFRAKPFDAPDSQKHLALKRILPHLAEDDEFVQMFVDEAKLTVQLVHPNVVRTYELGRFHTAPYILMEFISGQDVLALQRRLRSKRRIMSVAMACYVAREIARGLDYVHQSTDQNGEPLDIIHRDISPQNVLVTFGGHVKIIDFGIAKATIQQTKTQVGVLKGKFGYMSPEQVRGEKIDHRSDIFSAGILLWEMLTNRRLFRADNEYETLQMVRDPQITAPSQKNGQIPGEVDRIVFKALAADREERYQTAGEMAAELDAFLGRLRSSYEAEQLSAWMAEMFGEDLEAEREKRQFFRQIRTPDDVRRLSGAPTEDTRPDEALSAETNQLWDAQIAPDDDVDASQFASEHTVVAAGGFDPAQFANEEEEDVIALELDDLIEVEEEEVAGDLGYDIQSDRTISLSRSQAVPLAESQEFPATGKHRAIPNPSAPKQKSKKSHAGKKAAAAVAVMALLAVLAALAYLWFERQGAGVRAAPVSGPKEQAAQREPGTLVISVTPPTGVVIAVDGDPRGDSAPVTIPNLEPGEHNVTIKHPAYEIYRDTVQLGEGELQTLDIDLRSVARQSE